MAVRPEIYDLHFIVSREPMRKRVNLSTLPPDKKRIAWEKLKVTRPEVVELLKSPSVAEICKTFGAQILVPNEALE